MPELSPSMKLKITTAKMSKMTVTFYALISILFIVFSFSNGLYFDQSFMTTAVYWSLVGIVFFVWMMLSKIKVSNWLVADYLVFGYFLIYYLSSLWAANSEYGVLGFVRGLSFLTLYVMIRILSAKDNKTEIVLNGLIVSGVVFGLYGLANGFGTLNVNGAIFDPSMRRLASNFEYSNTFAIYQVVTFILAVAFAAIKSDKWKRYIYTISSYIILSSLILTYSRATWVVLAGTLLLFELISPKGMRGKIAISILIPTLTVIGTVAWLTKATLNTNPTLGWIVFLVGVLVVFGLGELYSFANSRIQRSSTKMGGLVLGIVVFLGLIYKVLNSGLTNSLVERLKSINLEQFSVVQRLVFYKDGMKVLSEHPILGAGPNAWPALYQRYQSYPYISRQSHSFLIDTIMNVGIVGTLLFFAAIVLVVWTSIRAVKDQEAVMRTQHTAILCALLALLAHGAIDFDFSYGTINLLMWALIALLLPSLSIRNDGIANSRVQKSTYQKRIVYPGLILSVIGGLIAGGYLLSSHYLGEVSVKNNTPEGALKAAQNATAMAPYRASAWLTRASYEDLVYKVKNDKDMPSKIKVSAEEAVKLAPYDPENLTEAIRYLANYGDGLKTVDIARQAWENGRYKMQFPEQYIVYSNIVGKQLFQKDKNKAKGYFTNAVDTYQDVERRIADFKNLSPVLHLEYGYQITPLMRLNAGEAAYYLGEFDTVSYIIEPLLTSKDEKAQNKAKIILAAIQGKQKKPIDISVYALVAKDKQLDQYYTYLNNIEPLK